jgi:hypothetical protein
LKVIQPDCRDRLTAEDLAFICGALGSGSGQTDALARLLTDPATRDEVLDDDQLLHAVLERHDCLSISHHLYFYILVRHALKPAGVTSRVVADYVAEVLAEFSSAWRTRHPLPGPSAPMLYLVDMVAALQEADEHHRFLLRAHIGNLSLFLSGVFPKHIEHRAERRAAPELSYYEGMGSMSFRVAGHHPLAERYNLAEPLLVLSDAFRTTRLALNDLAERLVDLGDPDPGLVMGDG